MIISALPVAQRRLRRNQPLDSAFKGFPWDHDAVSAFLALQAKVDTGPRDYPQFIPTGMRLLQLDHVT